MEVYVHATYLSGSICKSGLSVDECHRLQTQSHHHATYSGGSICVSGLSVQEDTECSTELLILVDVPVKVACRSTTATDCSHRAICKASSSGGSICESGLAVHESQDCRYRAITLLLILVEVSVKVSCRSTTGRHRLQHRAIDSGGSICESGLLVHNSHRLQPQSHHHATYPSGCTCKRGSSVHDSHRLQPQSHHHVTYCGGSTCEISLCQFTTVTDCRHKAITMQLILVEVIVKVAYQSTTGTD